MIPLVDLRKQYQTIKDEVHSAVNDAIESMAFINGPQIRQFEKDFGQVSGAAFGVGASSGTTALQLALSGMGIGHGDEVITVPNTFIATTEAITHSGARVVFVDIDERTYNIDTSKIEAAITDKTRAIIAVHLYGQPCDIEGVLAIAQKHNLKVIFDAAQAHLAEYDGTPIGTFGDAVCYSFYPGKNLGAYGDGGIVLTNDQDLAKRMEMLADHGREEKYAHLMEGFNYRLSEIQAAILNVKLKYLPEWTKSRQMLAREYCRLLKDFDVELPYVDEKMSHVYHLFVIRLDHRDDIKAYLNEKGIGAGIHYPIALHTQKAYQYLNYAPNDFPVAEKYSREILSLPMFPELTIEDLQLIVRELASAQEKSRTQYV